ncbi:MAG TPA: tetrathionate reductase family octaheme c-type cytochrome [Ignavibacteria bacterium]|nr:tetrathionate reductase family octaheme c-type cytochrome [Ignavibacteria bacterium]
MRKSIITLLLFLVPVFLIYIFINRSEPKEDKLDKLKETYAKKHVPSVDHGKLPALQKKFSTPQEVTLTCISCHTERHKEVMQTSHWQWSTTEYYKNKGVVSYGKMNALNNFCVSVNGSEGSCARCHIGYGYKDNKFDFTKEENVDCLVCHSTDDKYVKGNGSAGYPEEGVNLTEVSQKIGIPKLENCGSCHFYGGGGNNVKHGDLEEALVNADKDLDVHLAKSGSGLQCVSCHSAENHKIEGKLYSVSSMNRNRLYCEKCHTDQPHDNSLLNEHTVKVACQTCHIPVYAKANSTKIYWDWSKAGRLKDGEPIEEKDSLGNDTYLSIKGEFKWGRNLKPEYKWFNGTADHYFFGDSITSVPVQLNTLNGQYSDRDSKIYPVKVMHAKQPYDPELNRLVNPKLWDKEKGKGAYWLDFDWNTSFKEGMAYLNAPWSGKVGFVETESYWPVNHMVSPKNKSVGCAECHSRNDSRLKDLKDFYMPGRDRNRFVDALGTIFITLTLAGVIIHGSLRIFFKKKKKN